MTVYGKEKQGKSSKVKYGNVRCCPYECTYPKESAENVSDSLL